MKDPNFARMIESKTHMNLTNLDHQFVALAEHDKYKPLEGLLREFVTYSKKHKTSLVIFVNSIQSARSAGHFLTEQGHAHSMMHGDIPPILRSENFDEFKNWKTNILIATDLASRGLDFPFVSHIINLDFPWTSSDYLHRAGWAGRAGWTGFVISLYWNADLELIKEM